ncbi:hypothetical protein ACTPEM_23185, partial [Clostridioides difficile]
VEQVILDENKKIAYKCDLCKDNEKIACISACPQEALKLVTPIGTKSPTFFVKRIVLILV